MNKKEIKQWLKWSISPTLFLSDHYKRSALTKSERGSRVKQLNKMYLVITIIITLIFWLHSAEFYEVKIPEWVVVFSILYFVSRCNEIFMAFFKDVFDKLNTRVRKKNGLEYFERIQLSLRSYVELILNYGTIMYLISYYSETIKNYGLLYNISMSKMMDCIYFSVSTISTIGFGDIAPVHPVAKFFVMYEVINGMLLLVVSFTVYVNLTLNE
ncbi:MAG: potassium channel family protein [Cellulosilyticaceae bacterium]